MGENSGCMCACFVSRFLVNVLCLLRFDAEVTVMGYFVETSSSLVSAFDVCIFQHFVLEETIFPILGLPAYYPCPTVVRILYEMLFMIRGTGILS